MPHGVKSVSGKKDRLAGSREEDGSLPAGNMHYTKSLHGGRQEDGPAVLSIQQKFAQGPRGRWLPCPRYGKSLHGAREEDGSTMPVLQQRFPPCVHYNKVV